MGWTVRACTQTLATPDNLQRWGVRVDPKCALEGCEAQCTLGHLLSCCKFSLDRFKHRHDSCLNFIVQQLIRNKPSSIQISADLPGWRIGAGTVSPDLALTGQVPDIVIHDKSSSPHKIILLELTCPWDSEASFRRAESRYDWLCLDLEEAGLEVSNTPLEIRARDYINPRNMTVLASISSVKSLKKFTRTLGKISLIGSYKVWLARRSNEWAPGQLVRA